MMIDDDTLKQLLRINDEFFQLCTPASERDYAVGIPAGREIAAAVYTDPWQVESSRQCVGLKPVI
ncbi:MAG TPA: hypothetical protein VEQ38_14815 [Verrucomicrobiae bacterium]|jgi:hypothetical protein|nr:hypothetical protein [Verrucomicrobiae bacterium]